MGTGLVASQNWCRIQFSWNWFLVPLW